MKPHLLIRADADARMGTGHVMRCLALAQAWQTSGGEATFLTANRLATLDARLDQEGVRRLPVTAESGSDTDAEQTRQAALTLRAPWVVLDGYHFFGDFQARVRGDGIRVLAIDDNGEAGHYAADLVLNQNLHAEDTIYHNRAAHTELLLGPRFALLRREFWRWRGWRREVPAVARKVLVTLGGSDPDGVTLKVIQALAQLRDLDLETVVLVGGAADNLAELEAAARQAGNVELRHNVTDMPELMAWADVAVGAGGSTTWERALLGLPSLMVVRAENQRELTAAGEHAGLGWNLGWHQSLDADTVAERLRRLVTDRATREAMARSGPTCVDGAGAQRVVSRLRAGALRLRAAEAADSRMVWEWANEPATRAASFSSDPIAWDSHQSWFAGKLADPRCLFQIALDAAGEPIGQVRLDMEGTEAIISIGLAARCHGFGFGPSVIGLAARELFARRPIARINAYVRQENQASYRAFLKAGFRLAETTAVRGQPAYRLVLERDQACHVS